MFRKAIVHILLFTFLLLTFQDGLFYVAYKLNQDFITEKYCVNRDFPALDCQGMCHYQSKIKEAQDEKDENPFLQFEKIELLVIFSEIDLSSIHLQQIVFQSLENFIFVPNSPIFSILQPPD